MNSSSLRNPLALLAFSALCVCIAGALLLTGHEVPGWLQTLSAAGLVGGAGVMTPGLPTVERLLGSQLAALPLVPSPAGPALRPAGPLVTVGLTTSDLEPAAPSG